MSNFNTFMSLIRDGDVDGVVSTFQTEYLSMTDDDDVIPLHKACACGDLEQVTLLCDTSNIETRDKYNNGPIHVACIFGHLEVVKYLHEHGCDIEAPGNLGNRPLHLASEHSWLNLVEYLCSHQCELDVPNDNFYRPIHLACRGGYLDIVMFLCEQNCDIEVSTWNNYRPLHLACKHGHVAIVEYLCQKKCKIEAIAILGYRPIHLAVLTGHIDIVRMLCQYRCKIEAVIKTGESLIYLAKQKGHHIYQFLSGESLKRQLIKKIANMKVECGDNCDHSFCFESVHSEKNSNCAINDTGRFGNVFTMKDPELNYTFCVKTIPVDQTKRNQKIKYKTSNINNDLQVLYHERIVQYFGMIDNDQEIFIFLEYVEGISLDKRINKNPLPHNKVIQYSKEILEGLKFLHQNKIIHRDIKPQNIMLDTEDHVKICEFSSKCYLRIIEQKRQSSNDKVFSGTPNYLAPEFVCGEKYSYPVDIWGLGASVVKMLTGVPPFDGLGSFAVIFEIGSKKSIEFAPAEPMSKDMKSFVDQMLHPKPSNRATAEILLKFIDEKLCINN